MFRLAVMLLLVLFMVTASVVDPRYSKQHGSAFCDRNRALCSAPDEILKEISFKIRIIFNRIRTESANYLHQHMSSQYAITDNSRQLTETDRSIPWMNHRNARRIN